jgi:hypothetical protein
MKYGAGKSGSISFGLLGFSRTLRQFSAVSAF